MKRLIGFLKMTLTGGLLVVLPIWLAVLMLVKAIKGALLVLKPIAALLPQQVVNDYLVALVLLLAICFVTGLLMSARPVQRPGSGWRGIFSNTCPVTRCCAAMTRQLTGKDEEQIFQPALVEIENALVPAFIVEKHADGQFTVFVSSSPTPMAGATTFCRPNACIPWTCRWPKRWSASRNGVPAQAQWLAAMRPK